MSKLKNLRRNIDEILEEIIGNGCGVFEYINQLARRRSLYAQCALQMATQIGVLKYENTALNTYMDKDAIVVLSFGTTFKDQRTKSIDATAKAIQAAHPNAKVVTAFTSHIVLKHIMENEGKCDYLTPEQTLDQLKREGYTRIALVSLDVIPGMEYKYDIALFHEYKTQFKKMTLATPLMGTTR